MSDRPSTPPPAALPLAEIAEIGRLSAAVSELEEMVTDAESRANELATKLHREREKNAELRAAIEKAAKKITDFANDPPIDTNEDDFGGVTFETTALTFVASGLRAALKGDADE